MLMMYFRKRGLWCSVSRRGQIGKALSGFYYVNEADGGVLTCRARGKFRKEGLVPLVGDWVEVRETEPGCGMVWEIEPRRNAFLRPAVANIDQMVVIASAAIPVTDPFLIDRVTAIAALKNARYFGKRLYAEIADPNRDYSKSSERKSNSKGRHDDESDHFAKFKKKKSKKSRR